MSENGEIVVTSIGMEIRLQDMAFLYDYYATDPNGKVYPLPNHALLNYIAITFSDGSEYVVWQNYKDSSKESIKNSVINSVYQDNVFGEFATYMFNRVIDPSLVTGVIICDVVFPVEVCMNTSKRFNMLPKANIFVTEEWQYALHEIIFTPAHP